MQIIKLIQLIKKKNNLYVKLILNIPYFKRKD